METRQPPRKKNRSSRPQPAPGKARIAMLETYKAVAASWPPDMNRLLSSTLDAERRAELWELMAESGDRLRREYAWALPDERALRVLEAYAPLVEVGAGKGYWASLLHARGVDVVAFDAKPPPKCYFDVKVGGPEVCASLSDRSLFLCYPDDACRADLDDKENSSKSDSEEDPGSLALACLRAYEGEAIVVVGESVCSGGTLSLAQAPWGRSCDSLFQVELAQSFHPVLVAALPRWPLSRDCIVVWLRTRVCPVVFEKESDDDSETDAMLWGDIPESEVLAADCAAPCARHLLVKPPTCARIANGRSRPILDPCATLPRAGRLTPAALHFALAWEEDEDSDGNPPSEWPEWKIQQHLRYCCYFCKDPDTFECEEQCKTCHQRACLECVRGCDECEEQGNCYEEGECYAPRFCDGCRAKELISQPCDPERKLCAACASWHFEDDLPTGHRCHLCYTERWRRRRDLVRMVEHCLLLSLKGRAAPRDDAPKATRVLDRLACEGHETLASVVLNFSVEGRPEGPRRRRRKLTAGKSTSGKAPRKQLATKAAHRRR